MPEVAPQAPAAPVAPPPAAPAPAAGSDTAVQNTGEQATPTTTPEGDKPAAITPEQAAKRDGRRFERKLDKAYRERAEAQARAEVFQRRVAELEQANVPKDDGAPRLEQFDYDPEKYAAAKAEHAKKTALKEHEANQRSASDKQARERLVATWEEKAAVAEEKYDDFATVVGDLQPTNALTAAIIEADNAGDIAYYLGKNPKEAMRIAGLPVLAAVREIGKLEAKLLAEPIKPATPSKAPAPITPVKGTAPVSTDVPSEQDDMKTWMRKRQKQVHKR